MILLSLSGLVVLAAGGFACVVWARRGGPRWVRGVALATLTLGELVRRSDRRGPESPQSLGSNADGGSDGGSGK